MKKTELKSKKQLAKLGMESAFGAVVATSLLGSNKPSRQTIKTIQYSAGAALVGFSVWHVLLNQQPIEIPPSSEKKNIQLNSFYTEISLSGKLTQHELKNFETKIESLLQEYEVPSINILADIREIEGIELKAAWNEFLFALRHYKQFKKIAIVGNKKFEKISINLLNKMISADIQYYEQYDLASDWLLARHHNQKQL